MYMPQMTAEKFVARVQYLETNNMINPVVKQILQPWVNLVQAGAPWEHIRDMISQHIQSLYNIPPNHPNKREHELVGMQMSTIIHDEPLYGEVVDIRIHGETKWRTGTCTKPRKLYVDENDVTTWGENEIVEWRSATPPTLIKLDPNNPDRVLV